MWRANRRQGGYTLRHIELGNGVSTIQSASTIAHQVEALVLTGLEESLKAGFEKPCSLLDAAVLFGDHGDEGAAEVLFGEFEMAQAEGVVDGATDVEGEGDWEGE